MDALIKNLAIIERCRSSSTPRLFGRAVAVLTNPVIEEV